MKTNDLLLSKRSSFSSSLSLSSGRNSRRKNLHSVTKHTRFKSSFSLFYFNQPTNLFLITIDNMDKKIYPCSQLKSNHPLKERQIHTHTHTKQTGEKKTKAGKELCPSRCSFFLFLRVIEVSFARYSQRRIPDDFQLLIFGMLRTQQLLSLPFSYYAFHIPV